jgi:signal transduction histidine kinase
VDQGDFSASVDIVRTLNSSGLGDEIVSLKVWAPGGKIVFSTNDDEIGGVFPVEAGLEAAWQGVVSAEISQLDREEHRLQREVSDVLLETYSPIREPGTGRIVAVVEFYQRVDAFRSEVRSARFQSWIISTGVVMLIYLSLVALVRNGSRTIVRQRDQLQNRIEEYQELLRSNQELHGRLRTAAARATALNEQFLRSIAAELHDGPGQEIGYALLTLGQLTAPKSGATQIVEAAEGVKKALERSLADIRSISSGLRSPELEELTLRQVVERAVRIHRNRTKADVMMHIDPLPANGSLAAKITVFRVVQEALSNSYRHGEDTSPEVHARTVNNEIHIEVADHGPGIDFSAGEQGGTHLGLEVMRERVELIGGSIVFSAPEAAGTVVKAQIPFQE